MGISGSNVGSWVRDSQSLPPKPIIPLYSSERIAGRMPVASTMNSVTATGARMPLSETTDGPVVSSVQGTP